MKYPKANKLQFILLGLISLFNVQLFAQFQIPPIPSKQQMRTERVYDYAGILSEYQEEDLNRRLIGYADTTATQIVIATIPSLNGDDISLLGARWGTSWGVGQDQEDNGIFILLSEGDRKIDISTGYGIEYRMTDLETKTIIDQIIIPEFKNGSYYRGLDAGVSAIFQAIEGEFEGTESGKAKDVDWSKYLSILVFLIVFILLKYSENKKRGGRGGGKRNPATDSFWDYIILSSSGRSSGSYNSGGGFGGGFGGGTFGGGSFGGGGASGSW